VASVAHRNNAASCSRVDAKDPPAAAVAAAVVAAAAAVAEESGPVVQLSRKTVPRDDDAVKSDLVVTDESMTTALMDQKAPPPTATAAAAPAHFSALVTGRPTKKESLVGQGGGKGGSHSPPTMLDWYTYHRGRAGQEQRDEETGDLLYDLPVAMDTNHHMVDEPTWSTAKVSLRFPLEDQRREDHALVDRRKPMFREAIHWDWLGGNHVTTDADGQDSSGGDTLQAQFSLLERSPMQVAASMAEEFGLSFSEAMDLAESIQGQLRSWAREEAAYAPPVLAADASGNKRERPIATLIELYGNVSGMHKGGFEDKTGAGATKDKPVHRSSTAPRRMSSTTESSRKAPKRSHPRREPKKATKGDSECVDEVRRRLVVASLEEIRNKSTGGKQQPGVLKIESNLSCHLCPQVVDGPFAQFACGKDGHVFCKAHLKDKLGMTLDTTAPVTLAYCPICVLHCGCGPCTLAVDTLASDFKAQSLVQECSSKDTRYDNLLQQASLAQMERPKKKVLPKLKSFTARERAVVPKINPADLPREVSDGIDFDAGSVADYTALFTEEGPVLPPGLAFSIEPANPANETKPLVTIEDGSVDFCNICRKHGSLLCCDFCPRAFHAHCVQPSDIDQSDNPWECPSCCAEKSGLPEDRVDGAKSLPEMMAAYGWPKNGSRSSETLLLLGSIYQMLLRLLEYDFGYMFSKPVDTEQLPEYLKIVKTPMDLGTISKRLVNGDYKESDEGSLETVAIRVLKDIELVWKNCFAFNVEGSSVYRMALVQERRAKAIRKQSFEQLFPVGVATALGFADRAEEEQPEARSAILDTIGVVRPRQSGHKISVSGRCNNGRRVALLDPDTRRIVKIFSTVKAAGAAVVFLLGMGHRCEWPTMATDTKNKTRVVIKDSSKNPTFMLFGYRWLFLDNLRNGEITFPKEPLMSKDHATAIDKNESHQRVRKIDSSGNQLSEFGSIDKAYEDVLKCYPATSTKGESGQMDRQDFHSGILEGKQILGDVTYVMDSRHQSDGAAVPEETVTTTIATNKKESPPSASSDTLDTDETPCIKISDPIGEDNTTSSGVPGGMDGEGTPLSATEKVDKAHDKKTLPTDSVFTLRDPLSTKQEVSGLENGSSTHPQD
jgi:hypothetical protein